jgi:microcystin-dependent protein
MPGQKISSLSPVTNLLAADEFPLSRSGSTYKIAGDKFASKVQLDSLSAAADNKFALNTSVNSLSSNTINVIDSPTIDLTYNSTTRTLSADILTSSLNFVPTGAVVVFPCIFAPTGWLALSGQLLSRAAQSALWTFANSSGNIVTDAQWTSLSAYGAFSQGDGSSTFRLPDLRGHFVRSSGTHTDGTAAGTFGIKQGDVFKSHDHGGSTAQAAGSHTHTFAETASIPTNSANDHEILLSENTTIGVSNNWTGNMNAAGSHTHALTIVANGDVVETRPKNIPLLYCIKT